MPLLWTPSHVIYDQTLAGNATNIDVTNLDYNNDGPWQLYMASHNPQGVASANYLFFNGDYVIGNYQNQWHRSTGGSDIQGRNNYPEIGYLVAGASSILIGTIMIDSLNYARYRGINCRRTVANIDIVDFGVCKDSTVVNITSLRIASRAANALGAGTRLILTRIAH